MTERIDSTSKLRHAIDSARTRDKIAFEDPAASPLGTDDEAGGTPPTRLDVATAARHEVRTGGILAPGAGDETGRTVSGERRGRWLDGSNAMPWLIGAGGVLLLGGVFVVAAAL